MGSDTQIHRDVLHELTSDTRIVVTAIGVAGECGAVTLTGNVWRYAERLATPPSEGA